MRARIRRRVAARDESGFTLVELLVTMTVIAGCLLGLIAIQIRALEATALAKQRQQATAQANRTMEQLRAMSSDDIQKGLHSSDVSDPNIATGAVAGSYVFRPTYAPGSPTETLVVKSTQTSGNPLFPHTTTQTVAGTNYSVRSYVTCVGDPANPAAAKYADQGYWLTVVATWSSNATRKKTKTVSVRSRVFATTTTDAALNRLPCP